MLIYHDPWHTMGTCVTGRFTSSPCQVSIVGHFAWSTNGHASWSGKFICAFNSHVATFLPWSSMLVIVRSLTGDYREGATVCLLSVITKASEGRVGGLYISGVTCCTWLHTLTHTHTAHWCLINDAVTWLKKKGQPCVCVCRLVPLPSIIFATIIPAPVLCFLVSDSLVITTPLPFLRHTTSSVAA